MAKFHQHAFAASLVVLLFLSPFMLSSQLHVAHADSPTFSIVNIQTENSGGQSWFYFCRGVNTVTFDVSVQNSGLSAVSGQLIISMFDNGRVPIEDLQSELFSVKAGETQTIRVVSNLVPTYAFVGIASAQVILENPSSQPLGFENITYYIGDTVTPNYVFSGISLTPSETSVIAGTAVNYMAIAYDSQGDYLDISLGAQWSISVQASGSWSENVYSAMKAGTWAVTASLGSYSATGSITVSHAAAANVALSPKKASFVAGERAAFSATASDDFGNNWDVTNSAVFSINSLARGSWAGYVYTAEKAGVWTVTGTLGSLSSQASLTVTHASISSLSISPTSANLVAGSSQVFTAEAFDQYGNGWGITNSTVFSVSPGAGGSWSGNTYIAAAAGTWTVSGSSSGFTNITSLTVTHGSPVGVAVAASPASVTSGCSTTFEAVAYDAYNNDWNVTSQTNWSVSAGAGGSWSGNTFTSANTGNWTVTANYMNVRGSVELTVYYPIDFCHEGTVDFNDIVYFVAVYINFYECRVFNPATDLNHDGTLNFLDLNLLVAYYQAYAVTHG